MSWFLAMLVVVAFAWIVQRARLPGHAREAVSRSRASHAVVRNRALSDAEKEEWLKQEAPRLLALFGRLALGSVLALGLPLAVVWVLDRAGLASLADVLEVLARVDFLLAASVAGILTAWWWGRRDR